MAGFLLELRADLNDAVKALTGDAETKVAADIANTARAMAPVGTAEDNDRHPGEYRGSIHADRDAVIASAPHAAYVEFGVPGRGIPAQHVLYRAAQAAGYQVR